MTFAVDTFTVGATVATFAVLTDGRSRKTQALVSVRHIPGGDSNIINRGGKDVARRSLTLYVENEAQMGSLEACAGSQGSLVYDEGSYTATLIDVDSTDWYPGDQQIVRTNWLMG